MQYIVVALIATVVLTMWAEPDSSPRAKSAKYAQIVAGNDGYPSGFE